MKLERKNSDPLWKQVHSALEGEIVDGVLAPGDRLPPESALSERFNVNRHTIRRATKALAESGLIRTERGKGSTVLDRTLSYPMSGRTRFSENMLANSAKPRSTMLYWDEKPADATVARHLEVPEGSPVIVIESLGRADGRLLYVSTGYFPKPGMGALVDAFKETGSLTTSFRRCGIHDYFRKGSRITTRPADTHERKELGLPGKYPVLVVEYINVDHEDMPIEYGVTRFAGDRIELLVPGYA